jgi:hypothetical protein
MLASGERFLALPTRVTGMKPPPLLFAAGG